MIFLLALAFVGIGIAYSCINLIIKLITENYINFNYLDLLSKVGYETYGHNTKITEWVFIDNFLWKYFLLGNFGVATIYIGLSIATVGYLWDVIENKVRP